MQPINLSRVLLAGLLCGLVINIGEGILNAVLIADQWAEAAKSMNKPPAFSTNQIVLFNVWGFITGLLAMWTYAALLPRFGAGPVTAACTGALTWFGVWALGSAGFAISDWLPLKMFAITVAWGLGEAVIGSVIGSRVYKD